MWVNSKFSVNPLFLYLSFCLKTISYTAMIQFHLLVMNTGLIVGKNKPVCEKSKLSDTQAHETNDWKTLWLYFFFSPRMRQPSQFDILVTICLTKTLQVPKTSRLSTHSPGSSAARSPGFGSAAPGSWEIEAAAPSSGSSTLVTVKCGILRRCFALSVSKFLPRDLPSLPFPVPFRFWSPLLGGTGWEPGSPGAHVTCSAGVGPPDTPPTVFIIHSQGLVTAPRLT